MDDRASANEPSHAGRGLRLVAVMRLGDVKARDKLATLLAGDRVTHVHLVRHAPVDLEHPRLTQVIHRPRLDQGVAKMRPLRSARNLLQCLTRGIATTRRVNADAVLGVNFTPYGLITWLIGRCTRRPTIVSLIGADFNTRLGQPILGPLLLLVLRRCARVTVFGDAARQALIDRGLDPRRVFVLPNTVDSQRYRPDPAAPAPSFNLVTTGYLIPRKRVDLLLRALATVRRDRPGTNLLILGDGVQRHALQRLAAALGVSDGVCFHGWSDDVPRMLRDARAFILLSEAEGLAMAMLEAMCSGLPPIVTDVGTTASVTRDGANGLLLPADPTPEAVAAAMRRLLDDEALFDRCRAGALRIGLTQSYARTTAAWDRVLTGLDGSLQ